MARYVSTVSQRTPEEAFAFMADMRNAPSWDPGVVEATKTTEGEVGPGTVYRVVVKGPGKNLPLDYQVAEYEPPHLVVLVAESSWLRSYDRITVEPTRAAGRPSPTTPS